MSREGMFRDEAAVEVSAGNGGDGCCSFRREKYVAFGGPSGGDGGDGGDVIFEAVGNENSLFHITRNRFVRAGNGMPGGTNNRAGPAGKDVVVKVPVGTLIMDFERGNLMTDMDAVGMQVVVAAGGKGGRGNARFASATNQTPRRFDKGRYGESRKLKLELKLVADIGLVGLPNAGKSTLLRRVTAARPRVADYPFTTLDPNLGIWETGVGNHPTMVLADIPGLIEGAAEGKGLGHQFLRHVERTSILLQLVDCSADVEDPLADFRTIRNELEEYSSELATRPWILCATKVEDDEAERRAEEVFAAAGREGFKISSVSGRGLDQLRQELLREVFPTV